MLLYSRIALLAQVAEVFHAVGGHEAALAEVRRRSGSWFDPAIVATFQRVASRSTLWAGLDDGAEVLALAEANVGETFEVDENYLDQVADAFAEVADAKSPFTAGHSRRVAHFADLIADAFGLDAERRRHLRRAVGRHGRIHPGTGRSKKIVWRWFAGSAMVARRATSEARLPHDACCSRCHLAYRCQRAYLEPVAGDIDRIIRRKRLSVSFNDLTSIDQCHLVVGATAKVIDLTTSRCKH